MTSTNKLPALGLALALAACQQQAPDNAVAPAENAASAASDSAAPAPPAPAAPPAEPATGDSTPAPGPAGNEAAAPAPTTPPLTDRAERSETGARALLLDFARAIELKRFSQAYALLSPADRKRWSRADFTNIFKDLGKIMVAVPTGTLEGAAGSLYYSAPVTITSTDKDGRPVRIEGEAVLRRVNDVDGATPAQLRWRFDKVTLDWTH
ncbi:hypothetical protein GGQ97_000926 [Sphingomonas kaistensis]|uniref:Lipoprotein n=1 Tax=Sphingomonas kaistensis TaxID=298708 RepID=A0A7X5Y5H5_9SPHN|nr:hypothetical protein [Sphingomonas kaistensis]NJC05133.1 hypothetical protein [Sphingomonas kaistensis]